MLQSIHDKAKGILGMIIVAFLALVFGLWGVGDYLTDATEKFAAKVDDMEISQSQFEQGLARQRQQYEQMFQGQLPDSPVFQQRMKEQVLEQLITQKVMQKMVRDEGYRVADVVLAQKIKSIGAFQQDGDFNAQAYQDMIQTQGMGVKEFENLYRSDLAVQQLQDAVTRSSIIGQAELNILNQIQQQNRDINFLQFNDIDFLSEVKISDEDIQQYFELNRSRYMHPERVSISYVELTENNLAKDIPVNEEAVRRLYDEYVDSIARQEQRKAQHILINVASDANTETLKQKKKIADDLLVKINNGESFETLAKENSEDPGSAPNGGDLGWVGKGMMVPEFEAALFKLKKGQISEPVKTSFGYHLIRFSDTKSENIASFESKKSELEKQYKAQLLEDSFYERSELMATTAYENDQSLQEVADALDVDIKTTNSFSRLGGKGIASNQKVRDAAFNPEVLSEGRNSEIIELSKKHVVVLRIDTHTEAKQKTLDEVKNIIKSAISTEKARKKSMAVALQALSKLEQGESIESKVLQASGKLTKLGSIKRDDANANKQILAQAFTMAKPAADKPRYKVVELAEGTAVIELKSVTAPAAATTQQLQTMTKQFDTEQANRDMGAVLEYLKSQSKIVRAAGL